MDADLLYRHRQEVARLLDGLQDTQLARELRLAAKQTGEKVIRLRQNYIFFHQDYCEARSSKHPLICFKIIFISK